MWSALGSQSISDEVLIKGLAAVSWLAGAQLLRCAPPDSDSPGVRQSPDGQLLISASHELLHLYRSTDGTGSLKSFGGRLPDCEIKAFPGEHVEAGEFSAGWEMLFMDEIKKTFRLQLAP